MILTSSLPLFSERTTTYKVIAFWEYNEKMTDSATRKAVRPSHRTTVSSMPSTSTSRAAYYREHSPQDTPFVTPPCLELLLPLSIEQPYGQVHRKT